MDIPPAASPCIDRRSRHLDTDQQCGNTENVGLGNPTIEIDSLVPGSATPRLESMVHRATSNKDAVDRYLV